MGIGSKLKDLIEESNITIADLAKETNTAPTTIYSIIQRDNKKVDIEVLLKIAEIFGVDAEYFAYDDVSDPEIKKAQKFTQGQRDLMRKYEALDAHGRGVVEMVISNEIKRIERETEERAKIKRMHELNKTLNAAHMRTDLGDLTREEIEELRRLEDEIIDSL